MKKRTVTKFLAAGFILALFTVVQLNLSAPVHAEYSMSTKSNIEVEKVVKKAQSALSYRNEYLIVKYKDSKKELDLENGDLPYQARQVKKYFNNTRLIYLPGASKKELASYKLYLEKSGLVEYVDYDYKVQTMSLPCNDLLFFKQWGLQNRGQIIQLIPGTAGIDINAVPAWDITRGDPDVVVAVLDTGIDLQHPELASQAWVNPDEVPGNGVDDDNNGYIDDINGFDFLNHDSSVFDAGDQDIHGTHVAGIIAAKANNRKGIAGVAPGVKIMALKFIGPEGGNISDAIEAIEYARSMGVKVSNNSWGGSEYSQSLRDAIEDSGMLFIAASGNSGADADLAPEYPAAFECDNIISVAALNNRGSLPFWSNYGADSVDLAAPGSGIMSILELIPGSTFLYGYISGTSQAAPFVTGTAALVYSENQSLSPTEVKTKIMNSVKPLSVLEGKTVSGGMVDAYGALNQ